MGLTKFAGALAAASILALSLAGGASADGYASGGSKDATADEGRKLSWSVTLGATSDYVFRGISLNDEKPAAQGSFDIEYGKFYAGVWGSNLPSEDSLGPAEIDVYAGFKPELGKVTFDLGLIGYLYPGEKFDEFGEAGRAEYLELKAGASTEPFKDASLGVTVYYSPDYQFDLGEALAVEGTAGYTFRQIGVFVPTLSGTLGWQYVEDDDFNDANGGSPDDDYIFWNVGIALAVEEKFTIDLRYWDTDIKNDDVEGLADSRFVASVKVTLP